MQSFSATIKALYFVKKGLTSRQDERLNVDLEQQAPRVRCRVPNFGDELAGTAANHQDAVGRAPAPVGAGMPQESPLVSWWRKNVGNEDQAVDVAELHDMLYTMGFSSPAQRQAAVAELDPNEDGRVGYQQCHKWLDKQDAAAVKQWTMLEQVWSTIDVDGSGALDRREARQVLQLVGITSYAAKKQAMQELDANGNGSVDFQEFCKWFLQQDLTKQEQLQDRGSAFTVAGRTTRITAAGENLAIIERLRQASLDGDVMMMEAALHAAQLLLEQTKAAAFPETEAVILEVERRLQNDEALRRVDRLYRAVAIQDQIQRLWDLMVVETYKQARAEGYIPPRNAVSLHGYQQMHIRLAIHMTEGEQGSMGSYAGRDEDGMFNMQLAEENALQDWKADVDRFSEAAHVTKRLESLRSRFREATTKTCQVRGFGAIFHRYDTDGSGSLEFSEFIEAVRKDIAIDDATVPLAELKQLFGAVDSDESSTVDAEEFVQWLWSKGGVKGVDKLVDNRRKMMMKGLDSIKQKFKQAAENVVEREGWREIFRKYDDDGSEELDFTEFSLAVQTECNLGTDDIPQDDMAELFAAVDMDMSGGIDATELTSLLATGIEQRFMSQHSFASSIFELASVWVDEKQEDMNICGPAKDAKSGIVATRRLYVEFFQGLFDIISDPVNVTESKDLRELKVWDTSPDNPNFQLSDLPSFLYEKGMGPKPHTPEPNPMPVPSKSVTNSHPQPPSRQVPPKDKSKPVKKRVQVSQKTPGGTSHETKKIPGAEEMPKSPNANSAQSIAQGKGEQTQGSPDQHAHVTLVNETAAGEPDELSAQTAPQLQAPEIHTISSSDIMKKDHTEKRSILLHEKAGHAEQYAKSLEERQRQAIKASLLQNKLEEEARVAAQKAQVEQDKKLREERKLQRTQRADARTIKLQQEKTQVAMKVWKEAELDQKLREKAQNQRRDKKEKSESLLAAKRAEAAVRTEEAKRVAKKRLQEEQEMRREIDAAEKAEILRRKEAGRLEVANSQRDKQVAVELKIAKGVRQKAQVEANLLADRQEAERARQRQKLQRKEEKAVRAKLRREREEAIAEKRRLDKEKRLELKKQEQAKKEAFDKQQQASKYARAQQNAQKKLIRLQQRGLPVPPELYLAAGLQPATPEPPEEPQPPEEQHPPEEPLEEPPEEPPLEPLEPPELPVERQTRRRQQLRQRPLPAPLRGSSLPRHLPPHQRLMDQSESMLDSGKMASARDPEVESHAAPSEIQGDSARDTSTQEIPTLLFPSTVRAEGGDASGTDGVGVTTTRSESAELKASSQEGISPPDTEAQEQQEEQSTNAEGSEQHLPPELSPSESAASVDTTANLTEQPSVSTGASCAVKQHARNTANGATPGGEENARDSDASPQALISGQQALPTPPPPRALKNQHHPAPPRSILSGSRNDGIPSSAALAIVQQNSEGQLSLHDMETQESSRSSIFSGRLMSGLHAPAEEREVTETVFRRIRSKASGHFRVERQQRFAVEVQPSYLPAGFSSPRDRELASSRAVGSARDAAARYSTEPPSTSLHSSRAAATQREALQQQTMRRMRQYNSMRMYDIASEAEDSDKGLAARVIHQLRPLAAG